MAKHYLVVVVLVTQSCPTLCNLVDYSPLGSSVHGILQARRLELFAVPFCREFSWPGDWTRVSCIATWCKELTHWKRPDAGKDWRQEKEGMTEDEMVGWHHWVDGRKFEQAPGVGDGQGGLACCSPWGHKMLDMTEWLNWIEHLIYTVGNVSQNVIK